ncbi:MAG: KamA family radical SAM protein [Thermodesulfobacteriota bacterium]
MKGLRAARSEPPANNKNLLREFIEVPSQRTGLWGDWRWQLKNRITTLEEIDGLINLTRKERKGVRLAGGRFRMAVTPYFLSIMDRNDPRCPVRRQAIPRADEFGISSGEMVDPCGEDTNSPVPGLVHRYPDRVLLIVTETCAMYCRYCTRKRLVGEEHPPMPEERFQGALRYIRSKKSIRDVLISGGDPLMLKTGVLEDYIRQLRAIDHIEIIRIGTRVPATLPMRVDEELVGMLKKYHPLYLSIHFTHPKEITPEVAGACGMLADAGLPLGSQTVLLKSINDKPSTMKQLMQELLKIRVRPYYIYQCDLAMGTAHFRTPVSAGINIMEELRGHTTGYAVPTFVIDAPGGGGKVPVSPMYVVAREEGRITLRNYENRVFEYTEPQE